MGCRHGALAIPIHHSKQLPSHIALSPRSLCTHTQAARDEQADRAARQQRGWRGRQARLMRLMEEDSDDQGDDDGGAGSGRPEDLSRLLRLEIADDNATSCSE